MIWFIVDDNLRFKKGDKTTAKNFGRFYDYRKVFNAILNVSIDLQAEKNQTQHAPNVKFSAC